MNEIELKEICRNVDIFSDDSFVGIKCKNNSIQITFPMGYKIGEENDSIRKNILLLVQALTTFSEETSGEVKKRSKECVNGFPILSYLFIISDYLSNGYYVENEIKYHTSKRGKVNWNKTIRTQKPYPSPKGFVYLDFVVRDNSINQNELITLVHRSCVYLCFCKLGWLYTSYIPEEPQLEFNKELFESIVMSSMGKTFNDKKRELFGHMLNVIREESNDKSHKEFVLGTTRFEYVWEKMIDQMFGIGNKEDYFPHTTWHLANIEKSNSPLEPDTLMIKNGIAYILDAKYYKYGITGNPAHLPATSSIAKQIVYAEYIEANRMKDSDGNILKTYNAFLMPFSKDSILFHSEENYKYIGYADAEWKTNQNDYEKVEAILVDINYLIENCSGKSQKDINILSSLISTSIDRKSD